MAFTAEPIALREIDEFSIEESKFVSILCIVAVETPSHGLGVMEFDVGCSSLSSLFFRFTSMEAWQLLQGTVLL